MEYKKGHLLKMALYYYRQFLSKEDRWIKATLEKTIHTRTSEYLQQNGVLLSTPQVTTYTYNEVGSRAAITYPNNTRTEYTYDALNRLTKLTNLNVGGSVPAGDPVTLSSYQYTLAPNGRRTGVTETRLESDATYSSTGITYTYDPLNRLIQEASGSTLPEANFNTTYTYDLVGNRLTKSSNKTNPVTLNLEPGTDLYTYNANDQLLTEIQNVEGDASSATYDYDANGSLISKIVTPDPSAHSLQPSAYSYTYNLENRLSSAQITRIDNGSVLDISTAYHYNHSGIRVSANSTITNHTTNAIFDNHKTFLVDASNHTGYAQVLEEFEDLSGTPTISYTIGNDVISQATTSGTSALMYDGHGSTRLLTDSTGSITNRYSYDAYGIMLGGNPTSLQPTTSSLLYSGEAFDVNLQQQYLRARWYDQNNGRFNRLDPFIGNNSDPQSLHKYTYTHNDPIYGIDPTGESLTVAQLNAAAIRLQLRSLSLISIVGRTSSERFAQGGAKLGRFFQQLGRVSELQFRQVLRLFEGNFQPLNPFLGNQFTRIPDMLIKVAKGPLKGNRVLFEIKWRVNHSSTQSFNRLLSQLDDYTGYAAQQGKTRIAVWSFQGISKQTRIRLFDGATSRGINMSNVKVLEGITDLFDYLKFIFGF